MKKYSEYLENYISYIEQLGADARRWNDEAIENDDYNYEKYGSKVRLQLESIEWWAKKAQKILDKIEKEKGSETDEN